MLIKKRESKLMKMIYATDYPCNILVQIKIDIREKDVTDQSEERASQRYANANVANKLKHKLMGCLFLRDLCTKQDGKISQMVTVALSKTA